MSAHVRLLAALLAMFCAIGASATLKKVKIGELYYRIDTESRTATVTHSHPDIGIFHIAGSEIANENKKNNYAAGRIVIPSSVEYDGRRYTVDKIDRVAFLSSPIEECVIPKSVGAIQESAFSSSGVRSVTIESPDVKLSPFVFDHCENLRTVNLPEGLTEISRYCFRYSGIQSLSLPQSVHTIGMCAFENCNSLSSISIPASLKEIGIGAFINCSKLPKLNLPANVKIGEEAFIGTVMTKKAAPTKKTSTKKTSAKKQSTKKRTSIYD